MSVRVIDVEPLTLAGSCDLCGSLRVMPSADGSRWFCDDCWGGGEYA